MIKTERLIIKPLVFEDWRAMQAIAADFRGSEYAVYDMPLPTDETEIKALTARFAETGMFFSVNLGNEMIGYICFHEDDGKWDIGFCFHSKHHKKGYAYESCAAIMKHLVKERKVKVFTAGTALKNGPSRKLLQKLGFVLKDTETLAFNKDENGNDIAFRGGVFEAKGEIYE